MSETLREYMDKLHCSQVSFDQLAKWHWAYKARLRQIEAQRDELVAALQEIGKRADLILAALPAPRLTVKQWHDAHGQAGMISAIAKAKEAR